MDKIKHFLDKRILSKYSLFTYDNVYFFIWYRAIIRRLPGLNIIIIKKRYHKNKLIVILNKCNVL